MITDQITSIEDCVDWVVINHRRVGLKGKKAGSHPTEHICKVVKSMPFGTVCRLIREGRLFRAVKPKE